MKTSTEPTKLPGVYILHNFISKDSRGLFCKIYNNKLFQDQDLNTDWRESYYSISQKNVIRGMHFQLPPHHHCKLVYVPYGQILDVILDLRYDSPTYRQFTTVILSSENRNSVYIPKGCAHGFKSLQDNSITTYIVSTEYNPENDSGINYNSFGLDWQCSRPIISERDLSFVNFDDFCKKNINWK